MYSVTIYMKTISTDNLSLNKNAYQNNVATSCSKCVAQNAVDGNITTCMRTEDIGITNKQHDETWWYVNLGGVFNLYNIRIQFRNDYGSKYSKYVVEIKSSKHNKL